MRLLERDAGMKTAELKEIRRQTNADYRSAVKSISEGDAPAKDGHTQLQAGIEKLDGMGAIIEASGDARYQQIASDYAEVTTARKHGGGFKTALVVSPTHKEADRVTDAIRDTLRSEGRLGKDEREFLSLRPRNLTEAQRTDKAEYQAGEVVQFVQNAKGFTRGERVTVSGAVDQGIAIKRANGSEDILPLREAKKFQVYRQERVALAKGDRMRITMNGFTEEARRGALGRLAGKKAKDRLDNGAVYEVDGFTKTGDIKLTNGFIVPKGYGGITHVLCGHVPCQSRQDSGRVPGRAWAGVLCRRQPGTALRLRVAWP